MASSQTAANSKKPFNLGKWFRSRKGQQAVVIVLFMIIPLALLFTFTYYPFAEMFKFSFYNMSYVKVKGFVGFKNYLDVFKRDDCFRALWLSLYYMVGAAVQLALALYLAAILSFKVKGGDLFKGCMFFPYLINGIAIVSVRAVIIKPFKSGTGKLIAYLDRIKPIKAKQNST